MKPALIGCSGPVLSEAEKKAFAAINPFGFILFARNVETPLQLAALCEQLRACTNRADLPIFVDEEGGRVSRLKGHPDWPPLPAMGVIGALYKKDKSQAIEAIQLHTRLTAHRLRACGINGNCAPVLDIYDPDASLVMGDRTFGSEIEGIITLGRAALETYLANGVYPVIKHLPGHGRVKCDPHEVLPFVDASYAELEAAEFQPFLALKDAPLGMNCHVVFRAIDPDRPVSLSRTAVCEVIRGRIGFEGLLMTDDLAMGAIALPVPERGPQALAAGADVALYCTGVLEETAAFCETLPLFTPKAATRWQAAQTRCVAVPPIEEPRALYTRLKSLLSL